MLVGICGASCSGKTTIAEYLVSNQRFTQLHLASPKATADEGPRSDDDTNARSHYFNDAQSLINFVTTRWQKRFVTTDVQCELTLDCYHRRPFFLLVSVEAPTMIRWRRLQEREKKQNATVSSLEHFVGRSDAQLFGHDGLRALMDQAAIRLLNRNSSIPVLHKVLEDIDLANLERLRPNWDAYFMQLAALAASRSNCMKRRVGCVLVREKRVISTGYNGTPRNIRNCNEGGCQRCNSGSAAGTGLSTCLCMHAEENALLEAGRERIGAGATLYCDTCPCLTCSIKITQVGISEVVYSQNYGMDDSTAAVLKEGGIHLRQFSPPKKGVVQIIDE